MTRLTPAARNSGVARATASVGLVCMPLRTAALLFDPAPSLRTKRSLGDIDHAHSQRASFGCSPQVCPRLNCLHTSFTNQGDGLEEARSGSAGPNGLELVSRP